MKLRIVFCILVISACFQNSILKAQGWDKTFTSPLGDTTNAYRVVETPDSGYVLSASIRKNALDYPLVIKTNNQGKEIWRYFQPNIPIWVHNGGRLIQTKQNDFIYLTTNTVSGFLKVLAIKIDKNGNEVWKKNYAIFPQSHSILTDAVMTTDSSQIVISIADYNYNAAILKISPNGDSLSSKLYPKKWFENIVMGDDGHSYVVGSEIDTINGIYVFGMYKIDKNTGNVLWTKLEAGDATQNLLRYFGRIKRANDGKIILDNYMKFDYSGQISISQDTRINQKTRRDVLFTTNKNETNTYSLSNSSPFDPLSNSTFFTKRDSLGRIISYKFWGNISDSCFFCRDMISTMDGGFLTVGNNIGLRARLTKFTPEGLVYSNILKGNINIDSIQNCRIDASESGFPNRLVSVAKNSETRFAITNAAGSYEIQIDTGKYTVQGILPNSNWRFCTPSVIKQFLAFGVTDSANFAAQAAFYCPQMRVSATTQGLRRCFQSSYNIRYTNEGTIAAQNAYITLKLDSLLEYIGATRPLSSRQGQTLRFNLGTVPIGFDDQFSVQVRVKCGDSTRLGQSLCTEARIFPDTICFPAPNWSGANIFVSGRCDRDSVRFLIQNTGTATSVPLRRKIVEDEIVFLNGLISVPAGGSQTIAVPANGKTWQLQMEQEPNNPLSNRPTALVEGCRTSATIPISTGFVNQFPTDDGSPTIDNVCTQIVGSYDPNDKEGLPLGYKATHLVEQNQDIEYRIRFQNTGTDTAFTVVVRDTLSNFLDIASLKTGASSHRFQWTIEGKNVLVFRFENINLPDSFRNIAASQGFVKFKISQKKDVVLGTKIMNQADIYFDFNAPVRTNQTVHTIGKDFIITALETISPLPNVAIKVYPNPFNAEATIEIVGLEKVAPLSIVNQFQLFDALGRQLRSEKFEGNQFTFERRDLPSGLYFFKIQNGERLVGSGKFLVK